MKLHIEISHAIIICLIIAILFTGIGVSIGARASEAEMSAETAITVYDGDLWDAAIPELTPRDYGYQEFTATAFCKCKECNGRWGTNRPDGQACSATGEKLIEGESIAADFSVLPVGTQVEISGMGIYTVHDCGCAIKGNRIDVYFDNHADALEFGVKTVRIRKICDETV